MSKRGTCPTCRFQVREVDESEDDEDFADMQMDLMRLREAVMAFWGRRAPIPFHANVETIVRTVQLEREDQERHRQERGHPPMQEWASCVRIVEETDTEWVYEVDRLLLSETGRSLKDDVALVQSQTEAGFLTCIYAMHIHDNDIVNAIMEITYEI